MYLYKVGVCNRAYIYVYIYNCVYMYVYVYSYVNISTYIHSGMCETFRSLEDARLSATAWDIPRIPSDTEPTGCQSSDTEPTGCQPSANRPPSSWEFFNFLSWSLASGLCSGQLLLSNYCSSSSPPSSLLLLYF